MAKQSRSYWGVLPGEIVHAKNLTIAAKYLYVILSSMAHEKGFCWPNNETLASEMQLSKRRVVELLGMLRDSGFIKIMFRQAGKSERRYIYCGMFPDRVDTVPEDAGDDAPEGCESSPEGNAEDSTPPCDNSHTPMREIRFAIKEEKQSEKQSENPPLPPTGGDVPDSIQPETKPKSRRPKTEPRYRPDWFERFWTLYPRKTNRVAAVRAWDKLCPDLDLCRVMTVAIWAQMQTPQWRDGPEHIPHPSTWLNGARWLDEVALAPPGESNTGGWAPDPEVY